VTDIEDGDVEQDDTEPLLAEQEVAERDEVNHDAELEEFVSILSFGVQDASLFGVLLLVMLRLLLLMELALAARALVAGSDDAPPAIFSRWNQRRNMGSSQKRTSRLFTPKEVLEISNSEHRRLR
jgi:hypothetical protein